MSDDTRFVKWFELVKDPTFITVDIIQLLAIVGYSHEPIRQSLALINGIIEVIVNGGD